VQADEGQCRLNLRVLRCDEFVRELSRAIASVNDYPQVMVTTSSLGGTNALEASANFSAYVQPVVSRQIEHPGDKSTQLTNL
jgi:hypothetical protein